MNKRSAPPKKPTRKTRNSYAKKTGSRTIIDVRKKARRKPSVRSRSIKKRRFLILLHFALFLVSILIIKPYLSDGETPLWDDISLEAPQAAVSDSDMVIHAIDIGQGDCTLIQGGGRNILIDAGENGMGVTVVSYLRRHNIEHLDWAVCTHPHSDHIGGMDTVITNIPTDNVLMPKIPDDLLPTTKTYSDLMDSISETGSTVVYAQPDNSYSYGSLSMTVLYPRPDQYFYDDMNDYSVALRITCGEVSLLCCGDISDSAERDILLTEYELDSTIFKLSHHGSSYSNSEQFIDAVSPEYVYIMCGENNDYGHPSNRALSVLHERNIPYLRTDLCGDIVYKCNGSTVTVTTESQLKNERKNRYASCCKPF